MATETLFSLVRVWPKDSGRAPETLCGYDGAPQLFTSGAAAQREAEILNYDISYWLNMAAEREANATRLLAQGDTIAAVNYTTTARNMRTKALDHEKRNGKVQPRPYATDANWRDRERQRFTDGTYQALPWADDSWWTSALKARPSLVEHFAHVAKDAPGMLAYTPDAKSGTLDRQSRVRPGRYLSAHFADALSADAIRGHAARYAATFEGLELRFAESATSIERVYRRGPTSCMSHAPGTYQTGYHPTRIYADSDLCVAFIGQGPVSSSEFHVSARALVWKARKLYGRIYGDRDRMAYLLDLAGFTQGGTAADSEGRIRNPFPGARLPLRTLEGKPASIIMPYVDGHTYATVDDATATLTLWDESQPPPRGALNIHPSGGHETGIVKDSRPRCAHCQTLLGDHRGVTVTTAYGGAETWCDSCNTRDAVSPVDAPQSRFAPNALRRCAGSGRYYHDSSNLVMLADGATLWSRTWAETHGYEHPRGRWHAGARPAHVAPIPTALASTSAVSVGDLVRFMPEERGLAVRVGYDPDVSHVVAGIDGDFVVLATPSSATHTGGFYPYRFTLVQRAQRTANAA